MTAATMPIKRYKRTGPFYWSPDGTHFAYAARDQEQCFLVFDGEELRRQPCADTMNVSVWNLTFSPDSKHLAYTLETKDGKTLVVDGVSQKQYRSAVDGSEHGRFEFVASLPAFSPNSQTIAYVVSSKTSAGKWHVVLDGQLREAAYDEVKDHITDTSPSNTPRTSATPGGFFIDATDRRMNGVYFTGPSSFAYLARNGDAWYWIEEIKQRALIPGRPAVKKK